VQPQRHSTGSRVTAPFILDLVCILDGGKGAASRLGHSTSNARWMGNWMGPRTCLEVLDKRKISTLPGIERLLLRNSTSFTHSSVCPDRSATCKCLTNCFLTLHAHVFFSEDISAITIPWITSLKNVWPFLQFKSALQHVQGAVEKPDGF
jgi:hypothetical protein